MNEIQRFWRSVGVGLWVGNLFGYLLYATAMVLEPSKCGECFVNSAVCLGCAAFMHRSLWK